MMSIDDRLREAASELRAVNEALSVPQRMCRPRPVRRLVVFPAVGLAVAVIVAVLVAVLGGGATQVVVGPPAQSVDAVFADAQVTSAVSWHGRIVAAGSLRPADCSIGVGAGCGSGGIAAVWSSTASGGWTKAWTAGTSQTSTDTIPATGQPTSSGPPIQTLLDAGSRLYLVSSASLARVSATRGGPDTLEMWESTDTVNWRQVRLPVTLASTPVASAVYGHGRLVLLARSAFAATVWTSSDGANWHSTSEGLQALSPGGGTLALTPAGYILGLRTGDPQDQPTVWSSTDGVHWSPTTVTTTNGWVADLATRGNVTVALVVANYGSNSFYVTTDGRTWTAAPIPAGVTDTDQLRIVATGNGFLATNRYNMPLLAAPSTGRAWTAAQPTGIPEIGQFAADTLIDGPDGKVIIFGYTPGPGAFDRPWPATIGGQDTVFGPSNSTPAGQPISSIVFALATPPVGFTGDSVTAYAQTLTHTPTALVITRIDFGDGTVVAPPDTGTCQAGPVQTPGLVNSAVVTHTYARTGDHTIQIWSRLGCGADQSSEYNTTTAYSFPAAASQATSWPRCQPAQLTATVIELGVAAGNAGIEVVLRNTSTESCSLNGYPGLRLLGTGEAALPTTVTRGPSQLFGTVQPHLVGLAPGQSASFDIGYGDNPTGNPPPPYQEACPTATQLSIIPPGDTTALVATTSIAPCEGWLTTSPVVPGTAVIPSQ